MPNLVPIWLLFLKIQTIKQSGPVFWLTRYGSLHQRMKLKLYGSYSAVDFLGRAAYVMSCHTAATSFVSSVPRRCDQQLQFLVIGMQSDLYLIRPIAYRQAASSTDSESATSWLFKSCPKFSGAQRLIDLAFNTFLDKNVIHQLLQRNRASDGGVQHV